MLRWKLGAAILGAVLGGISGGQAWAEEPRYGGDLVWAVQNVVTTLNPHTGGGLIATKIVRNAYDSPLYLDEDGELHPWLLTDWELSEDELTYTFQVREGVTFHDGEPLNAEAFRVNFEKLAEPGYGFATYWNIDSVEVLSEYTVAVTLAERDGAFLPALGLLQAGVISPRSLEEFTDLQVGGPGFAGTGPFVLSEYLPNEHVVFTRNEDYNWPPEGIGREGPAYLDSVTYRIVPEDSVRTGSLLARQVDAIDGVPITDIEVFEDNPDFSLVSYVATGGQYAFYFLFTSPITSDIRVRQALQIGVDYDSIIEGFYRGHLERAWSNISHRNRYFNPELVGALAFDPVRANELLDEAGWTDRDSEGYRVRDGQRLTLRHPSRNTQLRDQHDIFTLAIKEELRVNLGVDLDYQVLDAGIVADLFNSDQLEVYDIQGGDAVGRITIVAYFTNVPGQNRSKIDDPEINRLAAELAPLQEGEEVERRLHEIQRRAFIDLAVGVPLLVPYSGVAAQNHVHGLDTIWDPGRGAVGTAYSLWIDN